VHAAAWGDTHLFHEGYALERTIVPFSHSVSPLPTLMSVVKTSADDLEFPIIELYTHPIWNFQLYTHSNLEFYYEHQRDAPDGGEALVGKEGAKEGGRKRCVSHVVGGELRERFPVFCRCSPPARSLPHSAGPPNYI
jgi:hypothetical protein